MLEKKSILTSNFIYVFRDIFLNLEFVCFYGFDGWIFLTLYEVLLKIL